MTPIERLRSEARATAGTVFNKFPKPIAQALSEQLNAWSECGHLFGSHGNIRQLVDEIKKAEPIQSGS